MKIQRPRHMQLLGRCVLASLTAGLLAGCLGDGGDSPLPPPASAPPPAQSPPPPPPEWSVPVAVAPGGCPIESRDAGLLYTAAGPADANGLDIWALRRDGETDTYDSRTRLGDPASVESANDFCPTPVMGDWLMFVSTRDGPDKCGEPGPAPGLTGADIFLTRYAVGLPEAAGGDLQLQAFGAAQRLACHPDGPNNKGTNLSPSLLTTADGGFLFYSSDHDGEEFTGSQDIYVSEMGPDGSYGPGAPVVSLNTGFVDQQPNVSRDGLSIVFASNRGGNMDIFIATRDSLADEWSTPRNLSEEMEFPTAGLAEARPSLSWDQQRLYYGADGQVYLSKRPPEP